MWTLKEDEKKQFVELCKTKTCREVADVLCLTTSAVYRKARLLGCKPLAVCRRCEGTYAPVSREQLCPACRGGAPVEAKQPKARRKKGKTKHKSRAFAIEDEMRKQGKRYADYQKERTIAEYARVKL